MTPPRPGRWWIGTSGWSYANWRGVFYPRGVKQGDWLSYYAETLDTVELNASFYRLPRPDYMTRWAERTPGDFLFSVKAWRMITHMKRLRDCASQVEALLERVDLLGEKAGPVLFQLPPNFDADLARLEAFLEALPRGRRYVFEFRDPSWHDDETYALLRAHNAAFCPFELCRQAAPRIASADFVYVRLHGRKARYRGSYGAAALADWADWLGGELGKGRDAYVYFDNTDEADHAVRNALVLEAMLSERFGG